MKSITDTLIDILPKLRPRISRQALAVALDEVESAARTDDEDPERFAKAWSRIEFLAFYLNSEECSRANAAWQAMDEARARTGSIRIIREPLVPHPEMDESHFAD